MTQLSRVQFSRPTQRLTESVDLRGDFVDADVRPLQRGESDIGTVGRLIDRTIDITGVLRDRLLSSSRCRYLTFPRAFIAYHGTRLGFSLTEIAHWLDRHPSTLLQGMQRCQAMYKPLFTPAITRMLMNAQTEELRQLFGRHVRGRR